MVCFVSVSMDTVSSWNCIQATMPNRYEHVFSFSHRPAAPQMTQPAFPTYSLYSPQQLLWLQHVYARQYYMQ